MNLPPQAWAGQRQWRVLEIGPASGLNFVAAWRAWQGDPQRPAMLHYVLVGPSQPLADELAAQCRDLQPGFHRLAFEGGRVLLTLCVGDVKSLLREQGFIADAVLLGGLDAKALLDRFTAKAIARLCRRGTRIAAPPFPPEARDHLSQGGFALEDSRHGTRGEFAPPWEPRRAPMKTVTQPGRCAVIGGGLAGAAAAASLARRGWQVKVLDTALHPASGASALPAGLLAPHVSADDNLLSRLVRCGLRISLQQAHELLHEGSDWQASGVHEQRPGLQAQWHEHAAWIKPAALVRAWLAQPGIEWRGGVHVEKLEHGDGGWRLIDARGHKVERADLVVVAAAQASAALLGGALSLEPVRGQVSWAFHSPAQQLPRSPLNGNGHFIPCVPWRGQTAWLTGSTYGRGDTSLQARPQDHQANLERLRALDADVASQVEPQFSNGEVHAWTGVRCAGIDRRPLLGEMQPGLWVSTAMGSRGLTFAALCAELMAARLHGEPLPLPRKLAATLDAHRRHRTAQ
ncbi:MAG: FAD-dependent oxidoreductase [Ramlibacter sp.]